MQVSKIGAVFLVSTLALAGIGISYAGLFDEILVSGEVDIANVDLIIEKYSCTDVWKVWGVGAPADEVYIYKGLCDDPARPLTEADVLALVGGEHAERESWAMAREWAAGDPLMDDGVTEPDAYMLFHNIFPCVEFKADLKFHYIGSIPAKLSHEIRWFGDQTITTPDGDQEDWLQYLMGLWWNGDPVLGIDPYEFGLHWEWASNAAQDLPQVHFCDTFYLNVYIKLPQYAAFESLTGEGYIDVSVVQWNDDCNGGTPEKGTIVIPGTADVCISGAYGLYSYWTVSPQLGLPNGYSKPLNDDDAPFTPGDGNIQCLGWCCDEDHTISTGCYDDVDFYNSLLYPGTWPTGGPTGNGHEPSGFTAWDCINYILNHKVGTKHDVQEACWYFINNHGYPTDPEAKQMVDEASDPLILGPWLLTYPQEGDVVAVLLDFGVKPTGAHYQWIFIEVDP